MILDTSFLIDLMENDESALQRKQKLAENKEAYRVAAPTIFELWSGISASDKPEKEKTRVLAALSEISTVQLNRKSAEKAGEIHGSLAKEGQGIDAIDSMIAAIAILENEAVLTRNIKHFTRVKGLRVERY